MNPVVTIASSSSPLIISGLLLFAIIVTFAVLVIVLLVRGVRRVHHFFGSFLGGVLGTSPTRQRRNWNSRYIAARTSTVQCPDSRCRAENPSSARFCRRCGHAFSPLAARQQPPVRRVAMW